MQQVRMSMKMRATDETKETEKKKKESLTEREKRKKESLTGREKEGDFFRVSERRLK